MFQRRPRTLALPLGAVLALALAACGATASPGGGAPRHGGTATFAEQPQSAPNYIFPLLSGAYFTNANTLDFQTLLYRPLYWFGDHADPTLDPSLSLADPPRYFHGDRTVTITLKPNRWSDGEPVSARDVGFWINLLRANENDWASYVPGGFPDNVTAWRAASADTIVLSLNRAYNPTWYTNNELSQITPLPIAWDRERLSQPAPTPAAAHLPDTTTAGARAVYRFLNGQAQNTGTYATSRIWSVVDGPWRLSGLTSDGEATFVPNPRYTGPQRPRLAKFVEVPFTSDTAEFLALRGGGAGAGADLSVGYVPDADVPQRPALTRQGFALIDAQPYGFNYIEPNFNNPQTGPIVAQLYFRQAFQHLIDQNGWITAFYGDIAVPTYSPVPAQPANPYADHLAAQDPYPFNVNAAAALLRAHGWRVRTHGTTTCTDPGRGAGQCGAGIKAGTPLSFTLLYAGGTGEVDNAMADLQSVTAEVGIQLTLKSTSSAQVASTVLACTKGTPACDWQLGNYASSWFFSPDHYPSGEEIFQTGALGNVNNYSDPAVDRLIAASTTAPAGQAAATLHAYADAVRHLLPDFWQPAPGTLEAVAADLGGVSINAYGYINPEDWYLEK